MSPVSVGSTFAAGRWKTAVVLLALGLTLLSALPGQAQPGPLTFFKNYFITGDYVVGGVGLRGQGVNGLATGSIQISGVPADADVVAAFLYWQVVTTTTAGPDSGSLAVTFKGNPLRSAGAVRQVADRRGNGAVLVVRGQHRLVGRLEKDVHVPRRRSEVLRG